MNDEELRDNLSLVRIPQIGSVHIAQLIKFAGSASEIFRMSRRRLEAIPGIGAVRAKAIRAFDDHGCSEKEIIFSRRNGIQIIIRGEEQYPSRLEHCYDAPHVLFYKGNQSLDHARVVSIVGTRSPTTYGRDRTLDLLAALAGEDILVVSGLAYGIDTIAHKEALRLGMPTVGVLAHGLDKIYPHANRAMASEMILHGGLLTEFWQGTQPDRQNFPKRNRIVSGLADAIVVVESGEKGGSLITATIANSYNRDVFAFPGKTSDSQSRGCNELIRNHQAQLISSGTDLLNCMNWLSASTPQKIQQSQLFPNLEDDEKLVYDLLAMHESVNIDEIQASCGLRSSHLASVLLSLELKGLVEVMPGKAYALVAR
jgi:DNA processing protein